MLRGIHNASSTWIGKAVLAVIMGFLVISFAIWGIGDIFRGFGRNEVAEIGGTEISVEHFRQYYNERLQQIARQLGRPIGPDQARALGLDRQILGQLVAETTLDERVKDMRLRLANADIAKRITNDPTFHGANGQFDPARFQQIINQAGYTEGRYVEEQRNLLLRRQIAQSVSANVRAPETALDVVNRYRNEKRAIDYLSLGSAQAGDVPAPTDEQLGKYFEERKTLFRAPEYRKVTVLSVTPADLAKPEAVSDADAKTYYEQHKSQYGEPEKREVRQIVFPKPEEAAAARERIAQGVTFQDIAKERGLKPTDTDLGMVAKSALIDPAVADAAFSLKPGEVSQPVKGTFGTMLVTVDKVEPGKQKTVEEVMPQIKREIAEGRAKTELGDLRDKIEDEKASGATLVEAAQKLGLKVRTIDAVDRSGRAPDGEPVPNLTKNPDVMAAAFASDIGVDNEALQLPDGGYIYFDVVDITPSRDRTLDEVKDKVVASWRDDQIAKRLKAKADEILGKLKNGSTLQEVAGGAGLTVQHATDLQRGKSAGFVPQSVVAAAFRTPKGEAGTAEGEAETTQFVFRVTEVATPKLDPNSPEAKAIAQTLQNGYAEELIGQYVAHLEEQYGVSINQSALVQVIGGEPGS
jgi:peptidyl-prolyl cis-trans isomerase D